MKTLLKAIGITFALSMSLLAGPTGGPAGSFIVNVSTIPQTQQFTVFGGTVTSQLNIPYLTPTQCLSTNGAGNVISQSCSGSGGVAGIVSPGTFTWTNNFGIALSTLTAGSATSVTFGNAPYTVFSASGTSQAIQVNINGTPSGGAQNQVGGVSINGPPNITDPNNSPALLVLKDSTTNVTNGSGLLEIWENNAAHDEYLLWIHGASTRNSDEPIRFDGPTFGIDEVNTSTDMAHGLGKWKVISEGYQAVDSQIASSRAWDNTTFENVVIVHRLDATDFAPGIYIAAQNLTDDSAVLTSSDTGALGFTSLNNHTVSITGPLSPTASYEFALPSTVGLQGEVLYNNGNRGNNFHARQMEWTDPGTPGQVLALTAASTPTWTTLTAGAAGNTYDFQYKNPSAGASGTLGRVAFDTNNNELALGTTGQIEFFDVANDHFVGFKSTNTLVGSTIWTLPDLDGSSGQVLTTLGSSGGHTLTWTTPSAGGGTPAGGNLSLQYNNSSAFAGTTNDFLYNPTIHALEAETTAQIQFYEAANDHFVGFRAQNTGMAGSVLWQLPVAEGNPGQVLTTSGSAGSDILSWATAPSISVYPATATASFPFGLTVSTAIVSNYIATSSSSPLFMVDPSGAQSINAFHTTLPINSGFGPQVINSFLYSQQVQSSGVAGQLAIVASTTPYSNFNNHQAPSVMGATILMSAPSSGGNGYIDFQFPTGTGFGFIPSLLEILNGSALGFSDGAGNFTEFTSSASATPTEYVLPNHDGSANQVLQTNGSAVLGWATVAAGTNVAFTNTAQVFVSSQTFSKGLYNKTINSQNANYVAVSTDSVILASATATSGITVTLPASSVSTGQTLTIEKVDTTTNTVTIVTNGTDIIQGTGTVVLNAYTQTLGLIADGTGGWIPTINQPTPPVLFNNIQASAVSVLVSSAIYVQGVYVPVPVSVTGFDLGVGVQAGNMDLGIYNSKYQLIFDTGTMLVPSAGINQIKIKPVNLAPGWYYVALTGNNGVTASFQRGAGNSSNINCEVNSANTAFPLPAAPTSSSFGSSALCFVEGLLVSGGVIQ